MLSNTRNIVANDEHFARIYVPEKRALIEVLEKVRKVNHSIWLAAYESILEAEENIRAAA
jgi:hypothetical protein